MTSIRDRYDRKPWRVNQLHLLQIESVAGLAE